MNKQTQSKTNTDTTTKNNRQSEYKKRSDIKSTETAPENVKKMPSHRKQRKLDQINEILCVTLRDESGKSNYSYEFPQKVRSETESKTQTE